MKQKVRHVLAIESRLIPADEWHPLDGVPAPEYVPPQWDGPHVGLRLTEAYKTLSRLPMSGASPKSGIWPDYAYDWEDLLAQQETDIAVREQDARQQNRARLLPTAEDISRMEVVIVWPARYIGEHAHLARLVQRVAFFRSREMGLDAIARRLRRAAGPMRNANRDALDAIASGLRRDAIPVF